jgi:hypothetical protein
MTRAQAWWPIAGAVAIAPFAGSLSVTSPFTGMLGAFAIAFVSVAAYYRRRLPQLFLVVTAVCLYGYTFLGKGFAYFGLAPLYVGELVFMFGVLAVLLGGGIWPAFRSPISRLLLLYACWGFARTLPYITGYGLEALRDATIWGYGAFALLVAGFLLRLRCWTKVPEIYARWFWWFAFWSPVAGIIFSTVEPSIPRVPGSGGIPVLFVKAGDFGVHLAGVATFVLVGLADSHWPPRSHRTWLEWGWWMAWLGGVAITGATSRGALLSVLVAVAAVMVLHRRARLWKPALVSLAFVTLFVGADIRLNVGQEREVSAEQIKENLRSIVAGRSNTSNLEGTRTWRLQWWTDIIDYTVYGEYFWTGKGFGVNLADDDGYQGTVYGLPNRSPHNIQMTVLARMGVPGLVFWVLLQGTFAWSLMLAYIRARRERQEWWARVDLWVLSFWLAFMVNGAFDVFIEGPQGGIWFWCLIGFGIAALEAQRRTPGIRRHPTPPGRLQPYDSPSTALPWRS